jgi:hypothetical protein
MLDDVLLRLMRDEDTMTEKELEFRLAWQQARARGGTNNHWQNVAKDDLERPLHTIPTYEGPDGPAGCVVTIEGEDHVTAGTFVVHTCLGPDRASIYIVSPSRVATITSERPQWARELRMALFDLLEERGFVHSGWCQAALKYTKDSMLPTTGAWAAAAEEEANRRYRAQLSPERRDGIVNNLRQAVNEPWVMR